MILLICIVITIIVGAVVAKNCFRNGRMSINHVFCFSGGYFFYCVLPILYFACNPNMNGTGHMAVKAVYDSIPESKICLWLAINFLYYLAFIWGAKGRVRFVFSRSRSRGLGISSKKVVAFNYTQKLVFVPVFLLGVLILYLNRGNLLIGYIGMEYSSDYTEPSKIIRVMLSAYEFLLASCLLLYFNSNQNVKARKLIFNKWTIWFLAYSLLVLTTGGRLYVITSVIAITIFLSYRKGKGIKGIYLAGFLVAAVLSMGLIGLVRTGRTGFRLRDVLLGILSEPVYTNWSALTYVKNYNIINLFEAPVMLFSSFIMLISSILFRNKTLYVTTINDLYPLVRNPLGAMHFFATYNGGFGIIPSVVFLFLLGNYLGNIYKNLGGVSVKRKTVFCLVSANLLFSFFRDPFAGSLIKNIMEFSVLIPVLLISVNNALYRWRNK